MDPQFSQSLDFYLSENLPINSRFDVHHLSTPPTPCPALYFAPPGEVPEQTFCESHFLSVSITPANHPIQVFAIEVLIYTTQHLTTLFVSKADSTGYLPLLKLPQGTPSPLKTVASNFLAFLIEYRRRPATKLVLSLFARAQDQYLFPGSIENLDKHVLTDRGLVKWWCQVLDPILSRYPNVHQQSVPEEKPAKQGADHFTSQGFLRVPGCDKYETIAFFPNQSRASPLSSERWKASDPLRELAKSDTIPERCLIPLFPDDPKARFVDELDDELSLTPPESSASSSKDQSSGRWRSVRSLEEFWEMMAFRQECSAGRLVGFLWGVFATVDSRKSEDLASSNQGLMTSTSETEGAALSTAAPSQETSNTTQENSSASDRNADIISSPSTSVSSDPAQRIADHVPSTQSSALRSDAEENASNRVPISGSSAVKEQPESTKHYHWPRAGRGAALLREKDYRRIGKLLIHLDYADEKIAAESTEKWIREVAVACGGDLNWGTVVHGRRQTPLVTNYHAVGKSSASMLDMGLLRKKRRIEGEDVLEKQSNGAATAMATAHGVTVLSMSQVRKKPKEHHGHDGVEVNLDI